MTAMLPDLAFDPEILEAQAQTFRDFGYVVVPDALPASLVEELLAAIEAIRPTLEASPHRQKNYGLSVRPMVDKHDVFLKLLHYPTTFPLAVRCLNHYSVQLMVSHLVEVPPDAERRWVGWHNDGGVPAIEVNGIRAFGSLKVGYVLTDGSADDAGQLMVVPGSHRLQGPPPFDGADPVGARQLKLKAGDAFLFQQGVWHASAPNHSNRNRVNLYYGYNYRHQRPIDYERVTEELLEKCSPLGRQLLGVKATHEGYYLPTEADAPLKPWFEEHFGPGRAVAANAHIHQVALDQ